MLIFVGLMLWVTFVYAGPQQAQIDSWAKFIAYVNDDKVVLDSVRIEPGYVYATMKDGVKGFENKKHVYVNTTDATAIYQKQLADLNVPYSAKAWIPSFWSQLLLGLAPILIIVLLLWFFISRSMRSAGGGPGGMIGNFGKSKHKLRTPGLRLGHLR